MKYDPPLRFPGLLVGSRASCANSLAINRVDCLSGAGPGCPDDHEFHYRNREGCDPSGGGRCGKTAIRSGFGIFYNFDNLTETLFSLVRQTPIANSPVLFNGTLATLLQSSGVLFPENVVGLDRTGDIPTVMNYSFSIQRDIGFGTVLDVGYVGSAGRHLTWQRNLNDIPIGANFVPANADPTNPRVPLAPAFLRPLPGLQNIQFREGAASSNYHSLQVTANRRFARGLEFGLAYTWSKSLDFTESGTEGVTTLVPVRVWHYGLSSFDRRHVMTVNWLWDVPRSAFGNSLLKGVFNDWQISGIASFSTGLPTAVGVTTTTAVDITGTPSIGARPLLTGDFHLPKEERTFDRNFRTEVFQLPAIGTVGNAAKRYLRLPGINNWDVAIFKSFPIRDSMRLQFRWEMYNAFNHTQFSTLSTTARFDPQGNQVNRQFGAYTGAREPRRMQFALRFHF